MGFKLSHKGKAFEPHPEYTGRAVCVDVTEPKKVITSFGEKEKFKLVFETEETTPDGDPCAVWSSGFSLSLHEKSGFRRFLKGWFGRDLTNAELEEFDPETLIGQPAFIVVVHEHKDNETYANIASCTAHKIGQPMKPSGKFKRQKDREAQKTDSTYRKTEAPAGAPPRDDKPQGDDLHPLVKVHVGNHKEIELRELPEESVKKLIDNWLPGARKNAKPSADDRRLIAALEWFEAQLKDNEIPMGDY